MRKKKIFCGVGLPLTLILITLFTGCPEPGTSITGYADNSGGLVYSVWVGETPRAGDWLTITFMPGKKVICSFSIDNSTNEWEYTFNTAHTGTITNPAGGWSPAPNGFTISGNTLTITNYGSHGGALREFRRVRQANLTVEPVPFTLGALAGDLVYSVWAGETPRNGDWLTITFMPGNKVIWSFSIDNTTNEWGYAFDSAAHTGTITTGLPWNPAPGGFAVSGNTLTITNYGGHTGPREFNRYR
ncbi:MAG: hypothetical protein FWD36_07940 [Treponema sp.]|nr:hypothetical protein [Treponema sp.]